MKKKKPIQLLFSRREFRERNGMSNYMYRRLCKRGLAPKGHKMGSKFFITRKEERRFQRMLKQGKLATPNNEAREQVPVKKKKKKKPKKKKNAFLLG